MIFPLCTSSTAPASWPGPSQLWPGRSPSTNVAVTVSPLATSFVIRPAHGRRLFQATAAARVRRTRTVPPWTTLAFVANSEAACSFSPRFSAVLHSRTTPEGEGEELPHPAARTTRARAGSRKVPRL